MTWIKCYRHGLGGDLAFRFVDDSPLEEDGFEPSVPPEKRTHLVEMFDRSSTSLSERDRGFESVFLQRRVSDEPVPRRLASIARSPSPRDVPPTCKWPAEKPEARPLSVQSRDVRGTRGTGETRRERSFGRPASERQHATRF